MNNETLRKRFDITSSTPPYHPAEKSKPNFNIIQDLNSVCERGYSGSHKLYIKHDAAVQIFAHIGWGTRSISNQVEQGGILLGNVFTDEAAKLTYGVVEAAIPGQSARGSGAYLEMTHETWKEMLDSADNLLDQHPQSGLQQIIGWYHTHPNELAVFMSGTDQATQSRLFAHDWQFAIVLNPHRKIWRSFYGANAKECTGHIITGIEDSASLIKKKQSLGQDIEMIKASRLSRISLLLGIFGSLIVLLLGVIVYLQIVLFYKRAK